MKKQDSGWDFNELLHPSQAFESPLQVAEDPDLTLNEKRAILASWASDACAMTAAPLLRELNKGSVASYDEVMDALRTLDEEPGRQARRYLRRVQRRKISEQSGTSGNSGASIQ